MRKGTFKQTLILGFILAAFLPLSLLGYFSYSYLNYEISVSEQSKNELLAKSTAKQVSSYLRDPLIALRQVSALVLSNDYSNLKINNLLDIVVNESDLLESIYILDNSKAITHIGLRGTRENVVENYIGLDFSNMNIFRNIEYLQGEFWSQSFFSPIAGKKSLAIILPVEDSRYIIGLFDISQLHAVIKEHSNQQDSDIIVLDDSGKPVFHPDLNIVKEQHNFSQIQPFQEAMLGNFGTYNFSLFNEEYISSSAIIVETKWLVMVVQPLYLAGSSTRKMAKYFVLAVFIAGVIVTTISYYQLRKLTLPLKTLQENIQAVAKGDYEEERVARLPYAEFENVAEHFRQMARAIERREQLLEINEERLVALLEIHNLKHLSEEDLLKFALEKAVSLTKSKVGSLHILDRTESHVDQIMWSERAEEFFRDNDISISEIEEAGLWSDTISKRKRIIKNNGENRGGTSVSDAASTLGRQLSVPIIDAEKIVAVVAVLHKDNDYDNTDARQLSLYFNHTWDILQQKNSDRDKARLSEQLAQAQKLEAIGTLAGGIAHDFNNVLMVIIGNTEVAKDSVDTNPEKVKKDLDEIFKASLRARDLVNQVLAFSRNTPEGLKPLDIKPIVKEAVKLLRSSIPANIEIRQNIVSESKPVVSEPGQINQLIMNLCTNAYRAMEGVEKGQLEIVLHPERLMNDLYDRGKMVAASGEYMLLSVKDNGKGIPAEMIHRIFEPYFTTREKERGTGLGLAVVHGIIKSLKGAVVVESEVGVGTEIKLYLPVTEVDSNSEDHVIAGSLPGGNERICYVDDDEAVALVNSRILENLGYAVTTFTSSRLAYETVAEDPGAFDLVMTDMAMPELTGDVLAEKILSINGDLPIILCTGYSERIDERKAAEIGIRELVLKPLTKLDLALTVRKVLGYKSRAAELG